MLLDLVIKNHIKTLSIIGMAKNVGKTVTFNHLVREASERGMRLGLTSIGRDGEKKDSVYLTPKPRIYAPAGVLIATAQGGLKNSEAKTEIIKHTGFSTVMGEVVVARVSSAGFVELVGPTLIKQQKSIIEYMSGMDVSLIMLDGAFDRISSAFPTVSEGTILATGAAVAPGMEDVLYKTRDRIERFSLAQADSSITSLYSGSNPLDNTKVVLIDKNNQIKEFKTPGSLVAGEIIAAAITPDIKTVLLPGAVGNKVLEKLTEVLEGLGELELVIRNGANLFSDRRVWQRYRTKGGTIKVLEPISLLAVTLNPTSPVGGGFDPEAFLKLGEKILAPYPVLDVVMGKTVFLIDRRK